MGRRSLRHHRRRQQAVDDHGSERVSLTPLCVFRLIVLARVASRLGPRDPSKLCPIPLRLSSSEQLHWFRGRVEKIVKTTVNAFPGVKVVWRSMHYPSDKNAKVSHYLILACPVWQLWREF